MKICRRLFVVPAANNNHGKSTIVRALVSQGLGKNVELQKKGKRLLISPLGREVDAFVFGRSYQEVEKGKYGSVVAALDGNDPEWRNRELIVMPSHVEKLDAADVQQMIEAAHSAGFDAVVAAVVLTNKDGSDNRKKLSPIWMLNWDERWTIPNKWSDQPDGQLEALGRDLWTWTSRALTG